MGGAESLFRLLGILLLLCWQIVWGLIRVVVWLITLGHANLQNSRFEKQSAEEAAREEAFTNSMEAARKRSNTLYGGPQQHDR